MFICEVCGKDSEPGEKQTKVSVETRKRNYPGGTVGHEIVKEASICQGCVDCKCLLVDGGGE